VTGTSQTHRSRRRSNPQASAGGPCRTPCWAASESCGSLDRLQHRPPSREHPEPEEVSAERVRSAGLHRVFEEESAELRARAEDLPSTVPTPAVVAGRQVEQFEGPRQGTVEPVRPMHRPRGDRAVDLAPYVGELLGERERSPTAGGETSVSRHPDPSAFHQPGDDLANAIPESVVLDIPRPVPPRWTDVDHRIKLDPGVSLLGRIEIDAPQVFLRRPVLDQRRFFVRMELTANGHDVSLNIDDDLDHIAELALGDGGETRALRRLPNNLDCHPREYSALAGETASCSRPSPWCQRWCQTIRRSPLQVIALVLPLDAVLYRRSTPPLAHPSRQLAASPY